MITLTKSLSEFIANIYGSVVDPTQWTDVLDQTTQIAGAKATTICLIDYVAEELNSQFMCSLTEEMYPHYIQSPHMDVEIKALGRLPAVQTKTGFVHTQDFIDKANRLFPEDTLDITNSNQWLQKEWGIGERYLCRLNIQPSYMDLHTVLFSDGLNTNALEGLKTLEVLSPHFAKAVDISRPFLLLKSRFKATLDVLDRFHLAVLILTPNGLVALRNNAADRILDLADAISISATGKLKSEHAPESPSLDKVTEEILQQQKTGNFSYSKEILLQRRSGQTPYLVEISPLSEPTVIGPHSGLMMIIIDPDHRKIISTKGMGQMFGLTKAEEAICNLLVDGYSTHEIAETRNVSVVTVKNQIKSLLAKTGNRSRSDLIRQALSINLPVDGQSESISV